MAATQTREVRLGSALPGTTCWPSWPAGRGEAAPALPPFWPVRLVETDESQTPGRGRSLSRRGALNPYRCGPRKDRGPGREVLLYEPQGQFTDTACPPDSRNRALHEGSQGEEAGCADTDAGLLPVQGVGPAGGLWVVVDDGRTLAREGHTWQRLITSPCLPASFFGPHGM